MRKKVFLGSTIIPLYLASVAICHDKMLFAALALVCAFILLLKGGAADPEQYDN